MQQVCSNCCKQKNDWNEEETGKSAHGPDIDRSMYVHVQQDKRTESTGDEPPGDGRSASVFRTAANNTVKCAFKSKNMDSRPNLTALIGSTCCNRAANAANINPADSIALPVAKDEPGPASAADVVGQTGRREVSLLRLPREGEAARKGATLPLRSTETLIYRDTNGARGRANESIDRIVSRLLPDDTAGMSGFHRRPAQP